MANHRPKSLSELNNVYDKAMRAERAIKEGSNMLSTPETEIAPENENIFIQLEAKAAEAQKREVFDPDITNIANDFLKRYTQPEKPKTAPKEIKRPAPSIQSVYHSPAKDIPSEKHDVPLSMETGFTPETKPQSASVHKPSHTMPTTETVKPEAKAPEMKTSAEEAAIPQPKIIYQAPEETYPVSEQAPVTVAPINKEAPTVVQASVKSETQGTVDYTPRPAPSRVRITSTERSELMEEYLRVMSDDDDEPSFKKPKFSFFKKKKKHEDEDTESETSLYEELPEEEDSAEEIPVVPFDSSEVKYTDEYSDAPHEEAEDEPMNLYDYIEADFDYDENDENSALDMSFDEAEKEMTVAEEIAEEHVPEEGTYPTEPEEGTYPTEPEEGTYPTEPEEGTYPTEPEDGTYPTEPEEGASPTEPEDIVYPEEAATEEFSEEAEETVTPEEEPVYDEVPTAGMVFEDIFSVSDESKRSHTGGNWSEVLSEAFAEERTAYEEAPEADEVPEVTEAEESVEVAEVAEDEYTASAQREEAEEVYEEATEDAPKSEESSEAEMTEEEDFDAPKKRTFLKVLMALTAVICLAGAGLSLFLSAVIGVDTGKLFSDKYRAFSVSEDLTNVGLNKGDLVIAENIYAHTDEIFVYTNQNTNAYSFGKVTASTPNLTGDYLYIAETQDGVQVINRDTSLGVVKATYGGIGTVLSAVCDYGIFLAVALVIFAVALIICLIILIRSRRRYEAAAAIYDNPDNFEDGDNDHRNTPSGGNDEDSEYYSDYDTDGIEQGLFTNI